MRGQLVDECVILKRGEAPSGQNKNLTQMSGHPIHLRQEGESVTQRGKNLPGLDCSRRPTRWPCSPVNASTCSAMEKEVEPGEGAVLRRVQSGEVGRPLGVNPGPLEWSTKGGGAQREGRAAGGQGRPLDTSHQHTCAQALSEKCFGGWAP